MIYKLRHLESGVPYLIKPGKNIVGRSSEADVQVDHESISRRHAQIENSGTILFVRDLSSTNGTFVNDQPVNGPTMVEIGAFVQIGEVKFRIDPESGGIEPQPPVVSWESYQRKTNKVPKVQIPQPVGMLSGPPPQSGNPAPEGPKWGPAITLPLQREGSQPVQPLRESPRLAVTQDFPLPWKWIATLGFTLGTLFGLIIGLILAKLLFVSG
jgi:hypothetical protein